jgi:hypothetical protein
MFTSRLQRSVSAAYVYLKQEQTVYYSMLNSLAIGDDALSQSEPKVG